MSDLSRQLIQVNHYQLVEPAGAYLEAIQALATRVKADGLPGVLGYQFYVDREAGTAGAVIIFCRIASLL